ncbi:hypothetical protein ACLF6K_05680 [Streptomyces xanthophaeus]
MSACPWTYRSITVTRSEAPGPSKTPVGERVNYQFEQPQTPEGSEPAHGG